MNKINWKYDEGLVGEKAVKKTEELLNTRLPEDFKKIATENDCGVPHPGRYSFNDGVMVFGQLFSIDPKRDNNIVEVTRIGRSEHGMSDNIVAFADDPAGNFLCFDYSQLNNGYPAIIFWDHEIEGGDPETICSTFTELLNMFHEDVDEKK
ncbi:SMI1/KNR4 family protein [Kroppenstedtia pulmonis]|uniref:SMI1/KNR4 family protein n=1 Tax=Kroppenstedtia pulmonis TaxID=1380685 RepID=A0A7D3Y1V4_9BACL|nr:SMI1/KNR4 family protein [Kroppenstedtia pulmonis]QKG84463.1 SMI1/KNR4 family protein [Kroppenstedtia pulmonis]